MTKSHFPNPVPKSNFGSEAVGELKIWLNPSSLYLLGIVKDNNIPQTCTVSGFFYCSAPRLQSGDLDSHVGLW